MRRTVLSFALVFPLAAAAQLPAGTRDASDHSRETAANAGNARLAEAETVLEGGNYAAAVDLLAKLAKAEPENPRIQYDLGFAAERTGAEQTALDAYQRAIAGDPAYAEPRLALALLDARADRTEKAHREFASVAQLNSASPALRARAFRGLAQLDSITNPAAASDNLLQAIKLTGETPEDIPLSATLAAKAGDAADAETAYRRLLATNPDDPTAASGLAHLELQANHPTEALAVLRPAIAAHPDDVRLNSQMAAALAMQGKTAEAIAALDKIREHDGPTTAPAVLRQLAHLYAIGGSPMQAEIVYRSALAKEPSDPTLLDDLADTLVREQKYAEAETLLKRAVAMREQFPSKEAFGDAASHLAFAASKNADPEGCLQALALRATVLPNSGPSLFLEATAHDTLHQYKEAIRAYRAFLVLAGGQFPNEEFEARHRLVALEHQK